MNCNVDPNGLCSALLVFVKIAWQARTNTATSKIKREKLIDRTMDDVRSEQDRGKIASGLRQNKGQKGKEY